MNAKRATAAPMKVSFVAVRTVAGEVKALAVGDSCDAALECYEQLRAASGRDAQGKRLYSEAVLFVRPKSVKRRLEFR